MTLEDIMHISGQALPTPKPPKTHPKSPRKKDTKKLPTSSEPKVRFLSTWESPSSSSKTGHPHSTQRRSIHHFCMELSLPQLPIHLQVASRQAHAKPVEEKERLDPELDKTVDGDSDKFKAEEIRERSRDLSSAKVHPPPNTPYTTTTATSVPITRGRTPVIRQDNEAAANKKDASVLSERPQTVGQSSRIKRSDMDDIVERAKSQLGRELSEEVKSPSSAKLGEKRVKKGATPRRTEVGKEEQLTLGGYRMKVAQDPAK